MTNDSCSILKRNASYFSSLVQQNPTFLDLDVRLALAESDLERERIAKERQSLLRVNLDHVAANLQAVAAMAA